MRNIGLGDRMKQYEQVTQVRLIRRMPVILRLDGKSFHRFTRGFKKPFDPVMLTAMQKHHAGALQPCGGLCVGLHAV